MDEKYIDLLIHKCMELKSKKSVLIHYSIEIEEFISKMVIKLESLGIRDIYLASYDPYLVHDFLKSHTDKEIEQSSFFDDSIWDDYAKKDACFLIFETEYPHLMDDVDPEKIAISSKRKRETKPFYRKKVTNCQLSWCIAAYPGECWANDIFKCDNSYEKLKDAIFSTCMLDKDDPILCWDEYLEKTDRIIQYLNQLELEKLVYSNSLGTFLEIYLPDNYLFSNARDRNIMVNMPSYEVFTSPDFRKTEGIVYSSRPLMYQGAIVDKFWVRFQKGRVVDYDAMVGKEILKGIIESDTNSCYLGECALVEASSPIASLNIVFGTTLIDENASCHLALGNGFPECIVDGFQLSSEDLLDKGVNVSKNHVDFMIGTEDLKIMGITKTEEEVEIMVDGNFSSILLKKCGEEND